MSYREELANRALHEKVLRDLDRKFASAVTLDETYAAFQKNTPEKYRARIHVRGKCDKLDEFLKPYGAITSTDYNYTEERLDLYLDVNRVRVRDWSDIVWWVKRVSFSAGSAAFSGIVWHVLLLAQAQARAQAGAPAEPAAP